MSQKPEFVAIGSQGSAGKLEYNFGIFLRSVMKGNLTLTPEEVERFKEATGDGVVWDMTLVEPKPKTKETTT